jgi:hypothetical protein
MKPKPWSHSALEAFTNCPRAYHAERVEKRFPYVQGAEAAYGELVHKKFEDRLRHGVVLEGELAAHEEFLAKLEALPGIGSAEQDVALNLKAQPCGYWDKDVWWRGKVDYLKINGTQARVVDWKTGKPHQKLRQLYEYALWVFLKYPEVAKVYVEYYWTKAPNLPCGVTIVREKIPEIWALLLPDINQFADAHINEDWTPRPSGLCKRHCVVVDCEFNGQYKG